MRLPHVTSCACVFVSTCTCAGKVLVSWKQCVWQENSALGLATSLLFWVRKARRCTEIRVPRDTDGLYRMVYFRSPSAIKWLCVIPDAVGVARGYNCYSRHLCEEQLLLSLPPQGTGKPQECQGKRQVVLAGFEKFQSQDTFNININRQMRHPISPCCSFHSVHLTTLYHSCPLKHTILGLMLSLCQSFSLLQSPTYPTGPVVEGGKAIFRYLVTVGGQESHILDVGWQLMNSHPHTHAHMHPQAFAHIHTLTDLVWELQYVSPEG